MLTGENLAYKKSVKKENPTYLSSFRHYHYKHFLIHFQWMNAGIICKTVSYLLLFCFSPKHGAVSLVL